MQNRWRHGTSGVASLNHWLIAQNPVGGKEIKPDALQARRKSAALFAERELERFFRCFLTIGHNAENSQWHPVLVVSPGIGTRVCDRDR